MALMYWVEAGLFAMKKKNHARLESHPFWWVNSEQLLGGTVTWTTCIAFITAIYGRLDWFEQKKFQASFLIQIKHNLNQ